MSNKDSNNIFKIPDFSKLYGARFISTEGDKFFALAISWWVLNSGFDNANSLLGVIMAATAIGTFAMAPFMGVLADKYSKKKCMIMSLLGGAGFVLVVLGVFPMFDEFPLMFAAFAIVLYAFEPLFETAMQGSLNFIVPPRLLPNAVSAVSGITSFSQALGAVCAGMAIAAFGIKGAFVFDFFTFIASAILVWMVVTKIPIESHTILGKGVKAPSYFKDLKEGFSYVINDKPILWLLIFFAFINLWVSPIMLAIPIITIDVFQGTAMLMSWFEVCLALGIIVSTIVLGYVKFKFNRYTGSFLAIAMSGISLVALSLFANIYVTFVAVFIFGVGLGVVNASMMTIFQTYVPTYIQGRFFSIVNTVAGAVIPLSYAMVGFVSDGIGIMPLMMINGAMLVVGSFGMLLVPKIKSDYVI